jgi:hypothetical protein
MHITFEGVLFLYEKLYKVKYVIVKIKKGKWSGIDFSLALRFKINT